MSFRHFIQLALIFLFTDSFSQENIPLKQLSGQYQFNNGMTVQFALKKDKLYLITPGNPLQEMQSTGTNQFRSTTLKNDLFSFKAGDTVRLFIKNDQGELQGTKVSDRVIDHGEAMDSAITLRRSSPHFEFWFSETDNKNVDSLIPYLENNYTKILTDFRLPSLPVTRVKIYPDFKTFHLSINQPGAPEQVMATAFGKDEFRMVSPSKGGEELMKFISHEFTHCVHLNIDYSPNNPRWLWEGVAMYESDWFMDPNQIDDIKNKKYPSLKTLGNGMEYMLGYVIIEAIKDLWSFDTVIELIRRQGNTQQVLNISEEEFQNKVFEQVYKKYVSTVNK